MAVIGVQAPMGRGKTLFMSMFATVLSLEAGGANIYSNYGLGDLVEDKYFSKHREVNPNFKTMRFETSNDFLTMARLGGGICCFDEMGQSLDSRLFSNNVFFTEFLMYLRKINVTLIFTAQHIENQIDIRIRNVMDFMVHCEKYPGGFKYYAIDLMYQRILRTWWVPMDVAKLFFGIYNTRRLVKIVKFPRKEADFEKFLADLNAVHEIYLYNAS